jgi:ABC-type antimicrobial peptide transport system permease subunit
VLVRLLARTREVAIRRAIGASYVDVVRLFVVENVLLIVGGALGLATAWALLHTTAAFASFSLGGGRRLALNDAMRIVAMGAAAGIVGALSRRVSSLRSCSI